MSDETYVDPNSGAAPQPGGWVGQHGAALGFAGAEGGGVEEEQAPAFYQAPNPASDPTGVMPVEAPASDGGPSEEEQADADASVEHQGVSSLGDGEDEGARLPGNEEEGDSDGDSDEEGTFDPADHTVDEVKAYIQEYPEQEDAVLAAERAGQARKSLVGD